jgi:hypothetical protein
MVSITRQSFHTPARQRHNPLLLIPVLSPKFADGKELLAQLILPYQNLNVNELSGIEIIPCFKATSS